MKRMRKCLIASLCLLGAFVVWTMAICFIDVQAIGPQGSSIGFAGINRFWHNLTGVHFGLYNITDWLGLVPIIVCIGFGILGLVQWVKRKSFLKVDFSILILGAFYIVTIAAFFLFEHFIVNYRPVMINGHLEASYPSSTTLLVTCVMPAAMMQFNKRIHNKWFRHTVLAVIIVFIAFMVLGRLFSGVHWLSDIVGGGLLSAGLVLMYRAIICLGDR